MLCPADAGGREARMQIQTGITLWLLITVSGAALAENAAYKPPRLDDG